MRLLAYTWDNRIGITLRVRAALTCVTLFAIFYGAIILAARQYRSNTLQRTVDQNIMEVADSVAAELLKPRGADANDSAFVLPDPRTSRVGFIVVADSEGKTIRQVGDRSGYFSAARAAMRSAVQDHQRALITAESDSPGRREGRSYARIVTLPARTQTGEPRYVQVGVVPEEIALVSRVMLDLLVFTFPGALLAAFCTGWVLAGYALQPLHEVGRAAEQMSTDHLDARVPTRPNEATEVAAVKEKLNAALERVQQGYRAHERFISNVAHELRTPIATMLTESQVIRMAPATLDDFRRYADSVEDEMRRLGRLVESFLMLARAEHGAPVTTMTNVSLNDILVDAVGHATPLARHYDVSIRLSVQGGANQSRDPIVFGDPDLLRTMIENLIQNALKFSPKNGVIETGIEVRKEHAVIVVRDRGPGIPPDLADTAFERFTQAPNEVLQFRGAGLGLAIARSIAVLHKGRISARNAESGGCIVELCIPLADDHAVPGSDSTSEPARAEPSPDENALAPAG
ncbi:MAG: hypothetical protein JNK58_01585 [Phycisphaerae bacterium]|nr:hypothetical protein [Phycisphaerae bacterium]